MRKCSNEFDQLRGINVFFAMKHPKNDYLVIQMVVEYYIIAYYKFATVFAQIRSWCSPVWKL